MKEFIEKLIKRLEEQKTRYKEIRKNTYCRRTEMDDCDSCRADHYLDARIEGINKAKEIINELTEEYKPKTRADKIRSMSDEELAEFLDNLTDNCCRCAEHQNCGNCQIGLDAKTGFCDIKKWLQSEAE